MSQRKPPNRRTRSANEGRISGRKSENGAATLNRRCTLFVSRTKQSFLPGSSVFHTSRELPKRKALAVPESIMEYSELEELQRKPSTEVLSYLMSEKNRFRELLNQEYMFNDKVSAIWAVIALACSCDTREELTDFLKTVIQAEAFTVRRLQQFMVSIQNGECKSEDVETIRNVIRFLQTLDLLHPSITLSTITIVQLILKDTIKAHLSLVGEDLLDSLEQMEETRVSLRDRYNIQFDNTLYQNSPDEPSESFRKISVFPDENDITNIRPFLRPCVVNGRYRDVEHYLDIQFRLLREDFVRPLREGILNYRDNLTRRKKERLYDIKIYTEITVLKSQFSKDGLLHQIQFSLTEELKRVKWENSKRLLFGSLLCFTKNNFESFVLGTVAVRDIKSLKEGKLLVRFERKDLIEVDTDSSLRYLMIETQAFFEAYRHVLTSLQEISEDKFPFKEYIVDLEKQVQPPTYAKDENVIYCLEKNPNFRYHKVQQNMVNLEEKPFRPPSSNLALHKRFQAQTDLVETQLSCSSKEGVFIHRSVDWSNHSMDLDDTQLNAVKNALTRSLAIIQGPPGTGKTYVGLKIIQILLHNRHVWSLEGETLPIVVVCYTNHALDQFLEGVLKITNRIVRIGSRSKCEVLSKYNLNVLKKNVAVDEFLPNLYEIKNVIEQIRKIESIQEKSYFELLPLETLSPDITQEHLKSFHGDMYSNIRLWDSSSLLNIWLGMASSRSPYEVFKTSNITSAIHSKTVAKNNIKRQKNQHEFSKTGYDVGNGFKRSGLLCTKRKRGSKECDLEDGTKHNILNANEFADAADLDFINDQRVVDEDYQDLTCFLPAQKSAEKQTDHIHDLNDYEFWLQEQKKKERIEFCKRRNCTPMSIAEIDQCKNVWKLKVQDRWRMYRFWLEKYYVRSDQKLCELKKEYEELLLASEQIKHERDLAVVRDADVVGLTTTGAARYKHLIRKINSKILIVEEAAEVLEAHIVTALSKNTEHLILIGDHQQLRPNPTVYELAKKYNLEMSLFERLIQNGLPYCRLGVQHRMKPCMSKLLVPYIYSNLVDHPNVLLYEDILGVEKSMFFLTHSVNDCQLRDSTSRVNVHEVYFLVGLCRYLLLQGYRPSQVTILTTYLAQLFTLKRYMVGELADVRVSVVDNFQGEESDIVLLSFVRGNEDGSIGFLKEDTRVCVALSRARKGLYCIGNFDLFCRKSKLWKNICQELKKQECYGPSMNLKCRNHGDLVPVQSATDLLKLSCGGCLQQCIFRLPCGHSCTKKCHPDDLDHTKFTCLKPCNKVCKIGHSCPKQCFEECGECKVIEEKIIPMCQHTARMECARDPKTYVCHLPCSKLLECGHPCPRLCGHICGKCTVDVVCEAPCGHQVNTLCCYLNDSNKLLTFCKNPCEKSLECGHRCLNKCGADCGSFCSQVSTQRLRCGHEQDFPCYRITLDSDAVWMTKQKTYAIFGCDRSTPHICEYSVLRKEFQISLRSYLETHYLEFAQNLEAECQVPCEKLLDCGHACRGKCGTCYGGRMHSPCLEVCNKVLFCGHKCKSTCSDICPPCKQPCQKACIHGKCRLSCGEPCTPCRKTSRWRCRHQKCSRQCHEPCDRPPCSEPCRNKLKCGHKCIGICGELCPSKCRICHQDQVTAIFFGNERDPLARFLQLDNCSHFFEIQGFSEWIKSQNGNDIEIRALSCPKCKKPIRKDLRFNLDAKMVTARVELVKEKIIEMSAENIKVRESLFSNTNDLFCINFCKNAQINKNQIWLTDFQFQPIIEDLSEDACLIAEEIRFRLSQSNWTTTEEPNESTMLLCENYINFILKSYEISSKLQSETPGLRLCGGILNFASSDIVDYIGSTLQAINKRILKSMDLGTNQLLFEIAWEFRRLDFLILLTSFVFRKYPVLLDSDIKSKISEIMSFIMSHAPFQKREQDKVVQEIADVRKSYTTASELVIPEQLNSTVQIVHLKQKYWYNCINDHVYYITNHDPSTGKSQCSECKALTPSTSIEIDE